MNAFFAGALTMAYLVAGLFFLRFWRDVRDRLFLYFAVAFAVLAVQRVVLALVVDTSDAAVPIYGLRLVAFVIIIAGVMDKNRAGGA